MEPRDRGQRIGPYSLVRKLGAGGSGEVWEAVLLGPHGFRKPVALKLLHVGPQDPSNFAGMAREARLGALLQHPNIVATLQLGEHDGVWTIALELVRGLPLDALCRATRGPLPAGALLEVGVQAAAALQHVHEFVVDGARAGLVHRDVKPSNLLLDRSGLVKLADLGVSVLRGERSDGSGTPGYMAPEQARGGAEPRSDLFSLGATLYALATGRRPFGRGEVALAQVREVEALLARDDFLGPVDAAVPGLGTVLRWCLRHDPADRPGSARELGEALAGLRARQVAGATLLELLARSSPELGIDPAPTPASDAPTRLVSAGNVRVPRDAFVGRGDELALLEGLVTERRWIVLLGPGGMGKTRLALEVARRSRTSLPGGAWVFELTEATDEGGVCAAVASALGLELDRRDPVGQLGRILAAKGRALVVVDNLEQCVRALPGTVARWIDAAPECTFLGTSRVVPALRSERVVPLGELLPDDAVGLFVARAPRPLQPRDVAEVGELCRALEHMPLSIELAAARLRMLDVPAIASRLSIALLSGGSVELPERHRSVTASVRWSIELLAPSARVALPQLSVFEGGFELSAAEAVLRVPDAPWALDVLQELTDASLAQVDPATSRFSMRLIVREVARTLCPPAELRKAEERHGDHFAQLGSAEAIAALDGPGGADRQGALLREVDNLVAACRRAAVRGAGNVAVRTLGAAEAVLARRGPAELRVELARSVQALPDLSSADAGRARASLGWALRDAGRPDEAVAVFEDAVAEHRRGGDRRALGTTVGQLGTALAMRGRMHEARARFEEALALHREVGNRRFEGVALGDLGQVLYQSGRSDEARDLLERALVIHREVGNRLLEGVVLGNLGAVLRLSHPDEARAAYLRALAIDREVGNRRFEGMVLGNLGLLDFDAGRIDEARASYEHALAILRETGERRVEGFHLANLGILFASLGRRDEARASYEQAIALQREVGDRRNEAVALDHLAHLVADSGRAEEARAMFEQALAMHRETGNRRFEGTVLADLGALLLAEGLPEEARSALEEALPVLREVGQPRAEIGALRRLASALSALGRDIEGDARLDEALAVSRDLGDRRTTASALLQRAGLALDRGAREAARLDYDEAVALAREVAPNDADIARDAAVLRARLG